MKGMSFQMVTEVFASTGSRAKKATAIASSAREPSRRCSQEHAQAQQTASASMCASETAATAAVRPNPSPSASERTALTASA